jgi:hypothetical protein
MMIKVNKSKGTIGVLSLLLLVSLAPSANAGKPGSIPTLDSKICNRLGGTWNSGKIATCTVAGNIYEFYGDFTIKANNLLLVTGYFRNHNTIVNNGTITITGTLNNWTSISNYGVINGCITGNQPNSFGTGVYNCL